MEIARSFISAWSNYLTATSWQLAILVAVIALVATCARRLPARLRYALWLLVLLKMLTPPSLDAPWNTVRWMAEPVIKVAPASRQWFSDKTPSPIKANNIDKVVMEETNPITSENTVRTHKEMPSTNEIPGQQTDRKLLAESPTSPQAAALSPPGTEPVPQNPQLIAARMPTPLKLCLLWFAGVVTFLGFVLMRYARLTRLLRRAPLVDEGPLRIKLEMLALFLTDRPAPEMLLSDHVTSPFLFGVFRPRIVLPAALPAALTPEELETVLLHELTHWVRRDVLVGWAQVFAQAFFWFHPFVWYANAQMRHERESACDEAVLMTGRAAPRHYGESLLRVLLAAKGRSSAAMGFLGIFERNTKLQKRLENIMNAEKSFRPLGVWSWIFIVSFALLVMPMSCSLNTKKPAGVNAKVQGVKSFPEILNPDQRLYMDWTEDRFRSFFDHRDFDKWSKQDRAQLEAKTIDTLNGPRSQDYYFAINTLGAMRSKKAVEPLLQIATERREKDNRDRWMAVRALGMIGDESVVPALIPLVYHPNQNTRFWAQISLVRLTGQNFGTDWRKWGEWWNARKKEPRFEFEQVQWTSNPEWSDPVKQREGDERSLQKMRAAENSRTKTNATTPTSPSPSPSSPPPLPMGKRTLYFNGEGNFLEIPANPALDLTNKMTLEAWICFQEGGTVNPRIISKGWTAHTGYELFTNSTSSERTFAFAKERLEQLDSNTRMKAGTWYHVAATYDGGKVTLYIDGRIDASGSLPGSISANAAPLNIGRNSETHSDLFKGWIKEVRIWNIARTQEEIQRDMRASLNGKEQGLVACWNFEDDPPTVFKDMSPNHLDARIGNDKKTNVYETREKSELSIKVRILDPEGRPAQHVQVDMLRLAPPDWKPPKDPWGGWADHIFWREAGTGRIWIGAVSTSGVGDPFIATIKEAGTYRAYAQELGDGRGNNLGAFGVSEPITVGDNKKTTDARIQLQGSNPLTIKIIDAENRQPLEYPWLLLYRTDGLPIGFASGNYYHNADKQGMLRFAAMPAGDYSMTVGRYAGKYGQTQYQKRERIPVKVEKGRENVIEVALQHAQLTQAEIDKQWPFVVEGKITDGAGKPVDGATIDVSAGMGTLWPTGSAKSDRDGHYLVRFGPGVMMTGAGDSWPYNVPLQAATVYARQDGFYEKNLCAQGGLRMAGTMPDKDPGWPADKGKIVVPLKPYHLDFVLLPAAEVHVRLVDSKGQPVAEQRFYVCGPTGPSASVFADATTDKDGKFTVGGVPCRAYSFDMIIQLKDRQDHVRSTEFNFAKPGIYEIVLVYNKSKNTIESSVQSHPKEITQKEITEPSPVQQTSKMFQSKDTIKLSYTGDTSSDKRSLGASGHAMTFTRPEKAHFVESLEIFASRYGYPEPPQEDFHLYLLNEKNQIIADLKYPYSMIKRGDMRWYELRTPSIEVPETFTVALSFNPHQTKGIYLGLDTSTSESRALVGLPKDGFEKFNRPGNWMIRVAMSEKPTSEKGVQRLADWKPPVKTDPFAGCIEAKYDTTITPENMQSYGGSGPAIDFPVMDFLPKGTPLNKVTLRGVRLYAGRYGSGYPPETTPLKVSIIDATGKVRWSGTFPYDLFNYKPAWVDLPFPQPLPLTDLINSDNPAIRIAFDPEAHQTKGIYFFYAKNPPTSHSFVGTVAKGFKPLPEREWVVEAFLSGGEEQSATPLRGTKTGSQSDTRKYIVVFKERPPFHFVIPRELFDAFTENIPQATPASLFRTKVEGKTLVGYILVEGEKARDGVLEMLNKSPKIGLLDSKEATEDTLRHLKKLGQPSLPGPAEKETTASPQSAEPPRIVATSPAVGATEVDPSIKEITVTFDRDMNTRGYSWTGGGEYFPHSPEGARAHWRDARTCVLPVQLQAARFYRVGINAKSFHNFRSADGTPVPPTAIYFATRGASDEIKAKVHKPKVVKMEPANGATDVDPALAELRVTFDMPMGEGFSWCGSGPEYPETVLGGPLHWSEGRKTCTLLVRLQPGHSYRLSLNSLSSNNFQSEAGVPLEPVVWTFKTKD